MPQYNVWFKLKKDATFTSRGDYVSANDVSSAIDAASVSPSDGDMCFVVDTSTGVGTLVRAKIAGIAFDVVGSGSK